MMRPDLRFHRRHSGACGVEHGTQLIAMMASHFSDRKSSMGDTNWMPALFWDIELAEWIFSVLHHLRDFGRLAHVRAAVSRLHAEFGLDACARFSISASPNPLKVLLSRLLRRMPGRCPSRCRWLELVTNADLPAKRFAHRHLLRQLSLPPHAPLIDVRNIKT